MSAGSRVFVGLDIGGTRVKAGMIREDELEHLDPDEIQDRTVSIDTQPSAGQEQLLDRLAAFTRELGSNATVGVGCPGVFDSPGGVLLRSANLGAFEGLDLSEQLAPRLGLRPADIRVDNDANLATYAEHWLGAGRGLDNMIMLTLGTGIGSGVILDGRLFVGPTGKAPELGHIVVRSRPSGEADEPHLRCGCGAYGCLERLASARAVMLRAANRGLTTDLAQLCAIARESDGEERDLLFQVGYDLGAGLLTATSALDVTCFVIGGGFGRALDMLQPGIEAAVGERDYGHAPPRLMQAELGASAGWIGAARLAVEAARS